MNGSLIPRAALAAACALLAGACGRDLTQPARTAAVPRADAAAPGSYVVAFSGGIPSDFAAQVGALGGSVSFSHAGSGIAAVAGLTDANAATLAASPGVSALLPDLVVAGDDPAAGAAVVGGSFIGAGQGNPTTAVLYPWQWNMRAIHADQAWAAGKLGSAGVTVAIIDSGIDYDALDLNGLVDLSRSVSFVPSDNLITQTYFPGRNLVTDYDGHGTNVATQVASKAVAFAGVSSRTTLMAVKVLAANNHGTLGAILSGVLWAADHGADVANMSIVGVNIGLPRNFAPTFDSFLNRAFTYAARKGMLVVVAAGNAAADLDHNGNLYATYCDAPTVLCVSATGPTAWGGDPDAFSFFSNYGRSAIDVAAPGGNADAAHGFPASSWPWGMDVASWVWSLCSKTMITGFTSGGVPITPCAAGNFIIGDIGTSQATPHVAGLAALLVAELGRGQPARIKTLIENSADDLGQPGVDPFYGHGRINVARALGL